MILAVEEETEPHGGSPRMTMDMRILLTKFWEVLSECSDRDAQGCQALGSAFICFDELEGAQRAFERCLQISQPYYSVDCANSMLGRLFLSHFRFPTDASE